MGMKGSGTADLTPVDRFDGGVGWLAYPEETMQRASHAIESDGQLWVVDPVDADGVDDLIAEYGEVGGVVVLLDRHERDDVLVLNVEGDLNELAAGFARDVRDMGGELIHFREFLVVSPPGRDIDTDRLG